MNLWVSRFGCPTNLHGDKGGNFIWNLFKNMCKVLVINGTSTFYYPHGNAIIEPTNRTIKGIRTKFVGEHNNNWSDYLMLVMMSCRS